jgi:hypothetical protein
MVLINQKNHVFFLNANTETSFLNMFEVLDFLMGYESYLERGFLSTKNVKNSA